MKNLYPPVSGRMIDDNVVLAKLDLISVLAICYAFGLLLIGQFTPEERLNVGDVSINFFYFLISPLLLLLYVRSARVFRFLIFFMVPLHLALMALAWSDNFEYGFYKIANLIVTAGVAGAIFLGVIERKSESYLFSTILILLSFLLIAAVIDKANSGFFDRDQPFFLNGPIVFARLMGVAGLISLLVIRGKGLSFALFLIFTCSVLWTFSKGPILSFFIVSMFVLFFVQRRVWGIFVLLSAFAVLVISVFAGWVDIPKGLSRIIDAFAYISGGNIGDDAVWGSIGSRVLMYKESIDLITTYPLGVGLGAWPSHVRIEDGDGWLMYPHNIFLEIFSEAGIFLGLVILIPFLLFILCKRRGTAYYICWFLLLAQQVSGDLLSARYLLVFSMVAIYQSIYFVRNGKVGLR